MAQAHHVWRRQRVMNHLGLMHMVSVLPFDIFIFYYLRELLARSLPDFFLNVYDVLTTTP